MGDIPAGFRHFSRKQTGPYSPNLDTLDPASAAIPRNSQHAGQNDSNWPRGDMHARLPWEAEATLSPLARHDSRPHMDRNGSLGALSNHSGTSLERVSSASRQPLPTSPASTKTHFSTGSGKARRPSHSSAKTNYSLYPAPSGPPPIAKPLPPLPSHASRRTLSKSSTSGSVHTLDNASSVSYRSSRTTDNLDKEPIVSTTDIPVDDLVSDLTNLTHNLSLGTLKAALWKRLQIQEKSKNPGVYYIDTSFSCNILASKHGNNAIAFWDVPTGDLLRTVKFSSYTQAGSRGREYFIRSHAILSEQSTLAAISTGLGNTIEIWNWAKGSHPQSIRDANRWAATRSDAFECTWPSLAVYSGDSTQKNIKLYQAQKEKKKPFALAYTIDLEAAGLPFVPQYPELAFSATSPLLVAAAGPRPPRVGSLPPQRSTVLVAWELASDSANASHTPYRVIKPWDHSELDTALPCSVTVYGSTVVSVWIPAGVRPMANPGGVIHNLLPVPVPHRHVLVVDLAASSTQLFSIPNVMSAVSPDCRFVAYCDTTGTEHGARGELAILDASTGRMLWRWPDPEASEADCGPMEGFDQLKDLGSITELAFSEDGGLFFLGDKAGATCVYSIRETGDKKFNIYAR